MIAKKVEAAFDPLVGISRTIIARGNIQDVTLSFVTAIKASRGTLTPTTSDKPLQFKIVQLSKWWPLNLAQQIEFAGTARFNALTPNQTRIEVDFKPSTTCLVVIGVFAAISLGGVWQDGVIGIMFVHRSTNYLCFRKANARGRDQRIALAIVARCGIVHRYLKATPRRPDDCHPPDVQACLLQRMSPFLAPNRPPTMSAIWSLSQDNRT